jgi:hypothetical protein
MARKRRLLFSVVYRLILMAVCLTGLYLNLSGESGRLNPHNLIYYTVQSNLWVLAVTALTLFLSLNGNRPGKRPLYQWVQILRYAAAVGITLTFLVFWAILSGMVGTAYLYTLNNLCVHTLVPVLFTLDFFLFDRGSAIKKPQILWAAAPPLYYLVFSLARAEFIRETLYTGSRYPYFFIDLDKYGWFGSSAGMGVLWWVLILLALVTGIGAAYRAIYTALRNKQIKKQPA